MRVLVTGSEGFVGRHLVSALERRGDDVIGVDKKSGGIDLSMGGARLSILLADHPVDAIVHLAASCSTPGSISNPVQTFCDTTMSAVTVLDVAHRLDIPALLTSSVKARDGKTPYGAAKRMAELWALEYRDAYGLPVIINRPGTIYGPGQEGSPESGWIAWFLEAARTGQTVTINGDGWQVRDLLHVSDYVNLLLTQLDDIPNYDRGYIWDVGGGVGNAVTINEIVKHLGLRFEKGPARYGDEQVYIGINDVPGWNPVVQWRKSETLAQRRTASEVLSICDCAECVCWMPAWTEDGETRCYDCVSGKHNRLDPV